MALQMGGHLRSHQGTVGHQALVEQSVLQVVCLEGTLQVVRSPLNQVTLVEVVLQVRSLFRQEQTLLKQEAVERLLLPLVHHLVLELQFHSLVQTQSVLGGQLQ
jgi:hypothetical protein